MTTRTLFLTLSDVITALEAECARLRFSPLKVVLDDIRERLDALIDAVVDEGVHDDHDDREETP